MPRPKRLAPLAITFVLGSTACGGSASVAGPGTDPPLPAAERTTPERATHYGGSGPAAEHLDDEAALWSEVVGSNPSCRCARDPRLILAAREHAVALAESDRPRSQTDIDHLRFGLLSLGGTDYAVQPLVIRLDRGGRDALSAFVLANGDRWSHCGLGIGRDGERTVAVWIGVSRRIELDRVPIRGEPGSRITIQGRLTTSRPAPLHAYLGLPGGAVRTLNAVTRWPGAARNGGRFVIELRLEEPGRHDLELLVDTGAGPEIAALLPLYAGVEPDARPVIAPDSLTPGERERGAARLTELINEARKRLGLAALIRDRRLDRIARTHSMEMVEHGFFGHRSPSTGLLADRLRNAEIFPASSAENVARSSSVRRVHHNLMRSPSHRLTVLTDEFTHLGLGLAWEDDELVVTEIFARW